MSEIIRECDEYAAFWEKMPSHLKNGREYVLKVDFDPKSNVFKVEYFQEKFDHGWSLDESGGYPTELHARILDGCQNVHEYLEAKAIEQGECNDMCESADDYILDRWGDCDYKGDSYDE